MPGRERGRWSSWLAMTAVCFVVGLVAIALLVRFRYGTWAAATHAWRGDVVLCDRDEVDIDRPQPDQTISFRLTNTSARSVRIVGAETSCTCMMTTGLPFDCPPGASKTLVVRFKPKKLDRSARESIRVFTDRADQRIIALTIFANYPRGIKG